MTAVSAFGPKVVEAQYYVSTGQAGVVRRSDRPNGKYGW